MKPGLIAIMLLFPLTALGQTYYVTTTGKATNNGLTWESPMTITKAAQSVQPGDNIIVRGGLYTDDAATVFSPTVAGTSDAPITLRGEDQNNPPVISRSNGGGFTIRVPYIVIQDMACKGVPLASCMGIKNTHHVTVTRFRAEGSYQGITIYNSDDCVIQDSVITYNKEGIYASNGSDRNLIRRNIVMFNGLGDSGDRDAIAVGGNGAGADNVVDGNTIAHNGQFGVGVYDAPRTVVSNNRIYDNGYTGISVSRSPGSAIVGNRVERNGKKCAAQKDSTGITVRSFSDNTVVVDNRVTDHCASAGGQATWDTSPRGGLDMRAVVNVMAVNNRISGTVNGPDIYVDSTANMNGKFTE